MVANWSGDKLGGGKALKKMQDAHAPDKHLLGTLQVGRCLMTSSKVTRTGLRALAARGWPSIAEELVWSGVAALRSMAWSKTGYLDPRTIPKQRTPCRDASRTRAATSPDTIAVGK